MERAPKVNPRLVDEPVPEKKNRLNHGDKNRYSISQASNLLQERLLTASRTKRALNTVIAVRTHAQDNDPTPFRPPCHTS
jgi:hypothetical protein